MNFEFEDIRHLFGNDSPSDRTEMIFNNYKGGVKALNKLKLWEWVRTFQATGGFCFSTDQNVMKMVVETDDDGHSGASFACMMRDLQRIACILIPEVECDKDICAICLSEDTEKKIVLECYHKFHKSCISYVANYCPLCRAQTVPSYISDKI